MEKKNSRENKIRSIIVLLVIIMPVAYAQLKPEFMKPPVCFADGEVFNSDGTPTQAGIHVSVKNLRTGEMFNMTTGYPNYPPVEKYNNDYKSVFMCEAGRDKVGIKAWNKTHYGYAETVVPENSQALLNITLNKKIESNNWKIRIKNSIIGKILDYFLGKW